MLARTCFSPSRRWERTTAPSARTSSSCIPLDSVRSTSSSLSSRTGAGSSASLGASAAFRRVVLGGRIAERRRPAPRSAADEPGRERDLADEASSPLWPGQHLLEQRTERTAQGELVSDGLGKGKRLDDFRRLPAAADAPLRAAASETVRAAPVRAQPLGDGGVGERREPADGAYAEVLQLLTAAGLKGKKGERMRREKRG